LSSSITDYVFYESPLWLLTVGVFTLLIAAMEIGRRSGLWRSRKSKPTPDDHTRDGYIVTGVLGLLALLLGFTFSLAIDRFDARRSLAMQESNSIQTALLRTDALNEPYRTKIRELVIAYIDNRLDAADLVAGKYADRIAQKTDKLHAQIWHATVAMVKANPSPIDMAFMDSINQMFDMANGRKSASKAHVPSVVFILLVLYMTIASGVLGYVLTHSHRGLAVGFMLLLTLALMVIVDIDGPTRGSLQDTQIYIANLKKKLGAGAFDPSGN